MPFLLYTPVPLTPGWYTLENLYGAINSHVSLCQPFTDTPDGNARSAFVGCQSLWQAGSSSVSSPFFFPCYWLKLWNRSYHPDLLYKVMFRCFVYNTNLVLVFLTQLSAPPACGSLSMYIMFKITLQQIKYNIKRIDMC